VDERRIERFEEVDLVRAHLRKESFPKGAYNKLEMKKISPCKILKRISDNLYGMVQGNDNQL